LKKKITAAAALSGPVKKPEGLDPVDWLISLKPEYQSAPIASWTERRSSKFLKLLAEMYAICPPLLLEQEAFDYSHMPLLDAALLGPAWALEPKYTPIISLSRLDRRGSMIGGFPWTSELFPWPEGKGGAMSPLIQLNLERLDLSGLGAFPPVLLQIWGDGIDLHARQIPLGDIQNQTPDEQVFEFNNEHLYFQEDMYPDEPQEDKIFGEELSLGNAYFDQIGCFDSNFSYIDCYYFYELQYEKFLKTIEIARRERIHTLIAEVKIELNSIAMNAPKFALAKNDHLGGWADPIQHYYDFKNDGKCLLTYCSRDSEQGLSIYFDGSLQLYYKLSGHELKLEPFASR
jgi:hypothetical protein